MTISTKTLKCQIDSRLAGGGLTALQCCQLQCAANILCCETVICVTTSSALPTATRNIGRLIYVADTCRYYFSDGFYWNSDLSSEPACYLPQMWGWGNNPSGRLADNTTINRSSPVQEITCSTNWCNISAAHYHMAGLKADGSIWSWGCGTNGGLGDNSTICKSSPVREVSSGTSWCCVCAGHYFAAALKTDGSLWTWGSNQSGRLGNNAGPNESSPVREISSGTTWRQLSTSWCHTLALKSDGTMWGWGRNNNGNLGDNTTVDRSSPVQEISVASTWCSLATGIDSSSAIKNDGTLWTWGNGANGKLGNNSTISRSSPAQEFTASTWLCVETGPAHMIAIKAGGSLWTWGCGVCGRLGNNSVAQTSSPVQEASLSTTWCEINAGCQNSSAIKTDGSLWSWGCAPAGLLGNNSTTDRSSPVREITSSTGWCAVSLTTNVGAIKFCIRGFV